MASTQHHHALQEGCQGPREFEPPPVEGPPHGRTAERIIIQPVAQHKPPAQREGMAGPAAAAPATGDTTCIWPSSDLTFHSSIGPACMILMIAAHHVLGMDVPISEPVTSSCMSPDRCVEKHQIFIPFMARTLFLAGLSMKFLAVSHQVLCGLVQGQPPMRSQAMRKRRAKKLWYRRRKGLLHGMRSKSHPGGPRRSGSQWNLQRGASHLPGLSCGSGVCTRPRHC